MAKRPQAPSVTQTANGNDNIQVVGSNNVINRITNFFTGGTDAQRAHRNRLAMLELVKNTWVKGVLEKSLYNEVLIELGLEERSGVVDHPWDMQLQMPDRANRILQSGTSIIDIFDEMNDAMLLLGEPGSGKTTMLLEIARDCIVRAQQDDNQPIPVVFNLSSWDGKQTIDDWLVNELRTKYNVPKKTAQDWVSNDDLQLMLDGLDEVKLGNRDACVKAINDFRQKHGLAMPIAICSRIADYEVLTTRLNLSGAVLLQPLTPQQIEEYFDRAGPELDGVHRILQRDEGLQELVKQPLILSVLTLAYQGVNPEVFTSEHSVSLQARRKHLFDTYIQKMFRRTARTKSEPYSQEQTKRWLAWLSQRMIENNAVPYLLENMQPTWVSKRLGCMYRIFAGLIAGLIYGLIDGLVFGFATGLVFGPINLLNSHFRVKTAYAEWFGPAGDIVAGLLGGLIVGVMSALFFGLIFGMIDGLFFSRREIKMVDAITWNFSRARRWLIGGFILALIIGTFCGVIYGSIYVLFNEGSNAYLMGNFCGGLIGGLIFALLIEMAIGPMLGLIGGLTTKPIKETTYVGQRLFSSLKNSLFILLVAELLGGATIGLVSGLIFGVPTLLYRGLLDAVFYGLDIGLLSGLIGGLFFGLLGGLSLGGFAVTQHYTLRLIVAFKNVFPWRIVLFLDYCVDRIFLRKVGGGYIFVHRLLMEHFAAMYQEE